MRVIASVLTSRTWLQMSGMRDYFLSKQDYLKSQVGNPEGADKPNKSTSCPLLLNKGPRDDKS